MQTIMLKVEGMHCSGCVKTVTRVLDALEGVSNVDVSLENASAQIQFDSSQVSVNKLIDVVENAGFDVSLT
ncbi:heavy-metal-associated domain-containing protein [Pasteurella dagmatis]|nr:heavy-metal-associated domain-containing protein [Pasteurella dagmatis]SNV41058.1 ATPase, P-type, K/Mg/Cd/Cu/Zn/Na/Ca/Na/H-transporter family protein [Pasteurella dagmatis]